MEKTQHKGQCSRIWCKIVMGSNKKKTDRRMTIRSHNTFFAGHDTLLLSTIKILTTCYFNLYKRLDCWSDSCILKLIPMALFYSREKECRALKWVVPYCSLRSWRISCNTILKMSCHGDGAVAHCRRRPLSIVVAVFTVPTLFTYSQIPIVHALVPGAAVIDSSENTLVSVTGNGFVDKNTCLLKKSIRFLTGWRLQKREKNLKIE